MQKLFFILLLCVGLYAQNPKAFSALGDVIYNNVDKIERLKDIGEYDVYKDKIEKYVKDVKKAKKLGFLLDKGESQEKMNYLRSLRKFSDINDFFVHSVNRNLKIAIKENNTQLFSKLLNTGLVDEKRYKKEIAKYYLKHADTIQKNKIIERCLNNSQSLRAKQAYKKRMLEQKRKRELEKIKRIREQDRLEQERLERQLNQEVKQKKEEIRKEQKKELSNTI